FRRASEWFPAGPRGALHARRPEELRPAGRSFRRKRRGEERRGEERRGEVQAQMARGRDALLAATLLLLLAATAQCFLGCMMEGMNIIEGGAFARERAERLVSAVYAEGAKRRSARAAVRACAQEGLWWYDLDFEYC
ncbi:Protein of unknown function, partial [Gryllus bimaculatus]